MRLIDADAYENEMSKAYGDDWDKLHILESMPTVDTERHGHWIYKQLDNYKKYSVTCSVCGAEYIDNYDGYITAENFNGCPNCLAKMDEVTE